MSEVSTVLLIAVAAPLLLGFAVICLREPLRVALPVYTALIPFGGLVSLGSSPFSSASSLLGLLLGAGLTAQLMAGRRLAPRLSAAVPVWTVFLGLAAATTLWTINRSVTLLGLAVLASLVLVFLLVAISDVDRSIVRRTESALLLGSSIAILYGFYQLLFQGGLADDSGGIEQGGRFGNGMLGPNILAVTLLIPFAIALNRAFNPRDPGRQLPNSALAALMLSGVLMTGSRTGTLGAGIVVVVMIVAFPRGGRRGLGAALVVGALATVLVWTLHPLGLAERTFASATSSSGRLDIWEVGLAACADYCGIGSGWGTFPDVYAATQATVPGARVLTGEEGSYQPHNLWLLAVVELGIAGLLLLTIGLAVSLYQAFKLPPEFRPAAVGSTAGLIIGVFFLSSMEFKMFWLALMLVALYRNVATAEEIAARSARRTSSTTPDAAET
jgi:O-antigen ligase